MLETAFVRGEIDFCGLLVRWPVWRCGWEVSFEGCAKRLVVGFEREHSQFGIEQDQGWNGVDAVVLHHLDHTLLAIVPQVGPLWVEFSERGASGLGGFVQGDADDLKSSMLIDRKSVV